MSNFELFQYSYQMVILFNIQYVYSTNQSLVQIFFEFRTDSVYTDTTHTYVQNLYTCLNPLLLNTHIKNITKNSYALLCVNFDL